MILSPFFILINHLVAKIIFQEALFYQVANSSLFLTVKAFMCLFTTHNK